MNLNKTNSTHINIGKSAGTISGYPFSNWFLKTEGTISYMFGPRLEYSLFHVRHYS